MTRPTISAELAAAYRAVHVAYNCLPTSVQDSIEIDYDGFEGEVDAAVLADDRERVAAAIRPSRQHWLAEFEGAAR